MKLYKPFSLCAFLVLSLLIFAGAQPSPAPPRNSRHNHNRHHHHGHGHHRHNHHGQRHSSQPAPLQPPRSPPTPVPVPPHVTQAPKKHSDHAKANGVLVKGSVVVDKHGGGNFSTIGEAVAVAPSNLKARDGYFVIYIKGGVYKEYITIPREKTYLMFIGDGMKSTVITGDHNAKQGLTGYHTATVAVEGDGFVATGVTFRNTAGPENAQAVALRNNANHSAFFRCSIEGYQDTLYAHDGQQFYRECDIYGTVDFIYGEASAVFQKCNILARARPDGSGDVVTAQGRDDAARFSAIVIQNCKIDAAPDFEADGAPARTSLGRPWQRYATVAVMKSYIGAIVAPTGWTGSHGTEDLHKFFFGEYENYGPGADTKRRVRWPGVSVMNATQAEGFTVANLLRGDTWLPQTKVPFYTGLIES